MQFYKLAAKKQDYFSWYSKLKMPPGKTWDKF